MDALCELAKDRGVQAKMKAMMVLLSHVSLCFKSCCFASLQSQISVSWCAPKMPCNMRAKTQDGEIVNKIEGYECENRKVLHTVSLAHLSRASPLH